MPVPEKFHWPGVEYLANEPYVERYLLPVEGVETLLISTRRDVYWPLSDEPFCSVTPKRGEPNDGFILGGVWYQSMRQVVREQEDCDDCDMVDDHIAELVYSLEQGGTNLNRSAH